MGTLGYAILGLLARRPRTGYEISRAMQRPIGYFWTASHSQIYPELADLEADELVRSQVIRGPGPRDTKRYSLTKHGKSVFRRWLETPLAEESPKSELLLRVWSLWLLAPDQAVALITRVRDEQQERLAQLAIEEQQFHLLGSKIDQLSEPEFGQYATLRWGIMHGRTRLDWCEWLLARLTASDSRRPRSDSDRDSDPTGFGP